MTFTEIAALAFITACAAVAVYLAKIMIDDIG